MKGLYRRKRDGMWRFKLPNGALKSTSQRDEISAIKVAEIYRNLGENYEAINVVHSQLRNKPLEIVLRIYQESSRIALKKTYSEITHDDTEEALRVLLEAQGVKIKSGLSYKHYMDKAFRTSKADDSKLKGAKRFANFLPDGGNEPIETITVKVVLGFAEYLSSQVHQNTVNWYLCVNRPVFHLAILENNLIPRNPFDVVIKQYPKIEANHKVPFTEDEVDKMLYYAPRIHTEWETAILIGRWVGARFADATCNLEGKHYLGDMIEYIPAKTKRLKKKVYAPLAKDCPLKINLDENMRIGHLCPRIRSKYTSAEYEFEKIMAMAGIDRMPIELPSKTFYQKSFHSLRYTCNKWLKDSGVPTKVRQGILGHGSEEQNEEYAAGITSDDIVNAYAQAKII